MSGPADPATRVRRPTSSGKMLPLLYRTEARYGWSVGMRAITRALLEGCTLPHGPLLDLGCGGGLMLSDLRHAYPERELHGVDVEPRALAHAELAVGREASLVQGRLRALPYADETFALCLALDVYDQRGVELGQALAESWRVLRANGLLLLRVSAHSWLQGPHDAAFNTGHRYDKSEMLRALHAATLAIERITFANSLLSLPAGALRLLQRWGLIPFAPSLYTRHGVNVLLGAALTCEARWLRHRNLPGGISLYVVARKEHRCDCRDRDGGR